MDEREGESRGLEEEQEDAGRKTIPPPHSKEPNTDKGLWLSPEARWWCVGWGQQGHAAFSCHRAHACAGVLLPAPAGRLKGSKAHLGFITSQPGQGLSSPDEKLGQESWEPAGG